MSTRPRLVDRAALRVRPEDPVGDLDGSQALAAVGRLACAQPALETRVLAALRDISAEANEWEAQHRSADPNAPPDYASGLRSAAYDIEEALAIGAARRGTCPSEGGSVIDTSKPWGSRLADDHALVVRMEALARVMEKGGAASVPAADLRRLCELVRDLDDALLSERMGADL